MHKVRRAMASNADKPMEDNVQVNEKNAIAVIWKSGGKNVVILIMN